MGVLKNENMSLKEYFNSLNSCPYDFIVKISKDCDVSVNTVFYWISGKMIPDILIQKRIAEITGISYKFLFDSYPGYEYEEE